MKNKKCAYILFILLLVAAISLRIDNTITKIIGIISFPFIIGLIIVIITSNKKIK